MISRVMHATIDIGVYQFRHNTYELMWKGKMWKFADYGRLRRKNDSAADVKGKFTYNFVKSQKQKVGDQFISPTDQDKWSDKMAWEV